MAVSRGQRRTCAERDAGRAGLSVVMPTWNGAPLLRESLPLIIAACEAAGVPYEILVVDNGSEDETPKWWRRSMRRRGASV